MNHLAVQDVAIQGFNSEALTQRFSTNFCMIRQCTKSGSTHLPLLVPLLQLSG